MHIAIDDCTRLAYVEVLDDEKASSAIGFLRQPLWIPIITAIVPLALIATSRRDAT